MKKPGLRRIAIRVPDGENFGLSVMSSQLGMRKVDLCAFCVRLFSQAVSKGFEGPYNAERWIRALQTDEEAWGATVDMLAGAIKENATLTYERRDDGR